MVVRTGVSDLCACFEKHDGLGLYAHVGLLDAALSLTVKYMAFLNKRMNTNPRRGPFHYRAPGRILWRTIRGMIPHKTKRGAAALDRLKVFEGVPHPFDKVKRQVVPAALTNLRLKPGRKFCKLGDLSALVGWRYSDVIERLEAKRKVKNAGYYERKKALAKIKTQALQNVKGALKAIAEPLAKLGAPLKL